MVQGAWEEREITGFAEIASEGRRIGPADAILTIVEFGDYECPACQSIQPSLEAFLEANREDVALVYRHYPLQQHRYAHTAARAAECAGDVGYFSEMHSKLFEDPVWVGDAFQRFAAEIGVSDLSAFAECTARTDPVQTIERDLELAESLGLGGTPSFIINGTLLGGGMPTIDGFEDRLAAARTMRAQR